MNIYFSILVLLISCGEVFQNRKIYSPYEINSNSGILKFEEFGKDIKLEEILLLKTKIFFSKPVQIESSKYLAVDSCSATLYEINKEEKKIKSIEKFKNQIYGLIAAGKNRLAVLVLLQGELKVIMCDKNLNTIKEFVLGKNFQGNSYWLSLSKICFWQNNIIVFTMRGRLPVLYVFANYGKKKFLLTKEPLESFWYIDDLVVLPNKVVVISDLEHKKFIFQYDGELKFLASIDVGKKVFAYNDKIYYTYIKEKESLLEIVSLEDTSFSSYDLKLYGHSYIHDILHIDYTNSLLLSIETGLFQAKTGSILGRSFGFLVNFLSKSKNIYEIDGSRRVAVTSFFPCDDGNCALLYKDRPLTHDGNKEATMSFMRIIL